MKKLFAALALVGSMAVPQLVYAMEDMSCADYTAMDAAKQTETLSMMAHEGDAAGGMMASDAMAPDAMGMKVTSMCADHPDMMLGEVMKGAM